MSLAHLNRQPFEESAKPPPSEAEIRSIALRVYEAVYGLRPLDHLSRWAAPHVLAQLSILRNLKKDRVHLYDSGTRIVPIPGRVILCQSDKENAFSLLLNKSITISIAININR